jgi:hypothetical protein
MDPSTLFMVRVWRQPQRGRSVFRASVRAVDAEHEQVFTRPSELAHYLVRASQTRSTPAAAPADPKPRSAA